VNETREFWNGDVAAVEKCALAKLSPLSGWSAAARLPRCAAEHARIPTGAPFQRMAFPGTGARLPHSKKKLKNKARDGPEKARNGSEAMRERTADSVTPFWII